MKRFLTCSIGLLTGLSLQAQEIEVHVRSGRERLPYAYVFINNTIFGSADSAGCVRIPRDLLCVGDTLRASYVGIRDAFEIYRGGDSCTLEIPDFGIASVTILPGNGNLHRKIRRRKYRDFRQTLEGRYTLVNDTQRITGRFEYRIVPDRTHTYDIRLETRPDPESRTLHGFESKMLQSIVNNGALGSCITRSVASNRGLRILYEGRDREGFDMYTIIRPAMKMAEELPEEQSKFYVDSATRDVVRCVTCDYFTHARLETDTRFAFREEYAYPAEIRARLFLDDGREIRCEITEIEFDTHPKKR